eukprot:1157423-Pelagomonas_calceolata.AAC.4
MHAPAVARAASASHTQGCAPRRTMQGLAQARLNLLHTQEGGANAEHAWRSGGAQASLWCLQTPWSCQITLQT